MPNRTPKQQPAPHAAKDAKDVERMRLEHDLITDSGIVPATKGRHAIYCLTVIGTIEGHSLAPDNQKSTKYEHVIPQLVDIEEDLNTVGGDVEAGLALAELISGVSKPSATLVLGGGHSIGIPLAVSARKSFIVPTATMTVHPVRHSGMVLGVPQTLRYFEQMQERIVSFVAGHQRQALYPADAQYRGAGDGYGYRAGRGTGCGRGADRRHRQPGRCAALPVCRNRRRENRILRGRCPPVDGKALMKIERERGFTSGRFHATIYLML